MPLDPARLEEAVRQRTRMLDAVHAADVARADFEHAVRRLHAAGATFREIGSALSLSHQRVHQIVDDGSPRRRRRDRAKGEGRRCLCSFCGREQSTVGKVIAGPGVFIWQGCVALAVEAGTTGGTVSDERIRVTPLPADTGETCRFCGKAGPLVAYLVARGDARICSECLVLCQEIIADESGSPST